MMKHFFLLAAVFLFSYSKESMAIDSIRVMSYNIRIAHPPAMDGGLDLPSVARVINESNADIVALQEVDVHTERSGTTSNQPKELAALTGMNQYFAKAVDRSGGDYGIAVLSKFPILKATKISLPIIEGSGSELRTAAICFIKLPNEDTVIFISTHLDHLKTENRALQVNTLLEHIKQYGNYPIILAGDFNTNLTNEQKGFEVLKRDFKIGCTDCPVTFPASKPRVRIDYILLNKVAQKQFSIVNYQSIYNKLTQYASDHLPIIADLKLK